MQVPTTATLPAGNRDEEQLKISLACPQCGAAGWTSLSGLKSGLRCPKCRCHFLVDSNGRMLTEDQLRRVRYTCPRCRQSGSIPSRLTVRKAVCGACRLTLVAGPDQQLHGEKEAAALRRAASAQAGQRRLRDRLAAQLSTGDGGLHWRKATLLAIAVVAALAMLASVLSRLLDTSLETRVGDFTEVCLTGDWNDAQAYLADDAVERAEFDRWRVRHFSSIIEKFRPEGDRVTVIAEKMADEPTEQVFQVTMKSSFVGTRSQVQHWRLVNGMWTFSPQATLFATDSSPRLRE